MRTRRPNFDDARVLAISNNLAWARYEGSCRAADKKSWVLPPETDDEGDEAATAEVERMGEQDCMERAPSCSWGPSVVGRVISSRDVSFTTAQPTAQAGEQMDPLNVITDWQAYHAVSLSPAAKDALVNILSIERDFGWDNALIAASELCLVHEDLNRSSEIRNLVKKADSKAQQTESKRRIAAALDVLTGFGGIDGAHHKAWTIDQAVRALCGVPVGPNGFCGPATNNEYERVIDRYRTDSEGNALYSWDVGMAP